LRQFHWNLLSRQIHNAFRFQQVASDDPARDAALIRYPPLLGQLEDPLLALQRAAL